MKIIDDTIKNIINSELSYDERKTAEAFVGFLCDNNFEFCRDNGYWKEKIYFLVKYKGECVCFISIKDLDEPYNNWTVWSDDIDSCYLTLDLLDERLKTIALSKVDTCGHCGSCGGGKQKVIFGKTFDSVCGCTFRFDNPSFEDLEFMKIMVELMKKQIDDRY